MATFSCSARFSPKSSIRGTAAFLSGDINDDAKCRPCSGQYACGGWERANPIPDGKSSWSTFGKMWQDNQQVLRNILETPPSNQEVRISTAAKISTNERQEILKWNTPSNQDAVFLTIRIWTALLGYSGLGGTYSWKKPEVENLVALSL